MKQLEKEMTFNEVTLFLTKHKKYKLTKDISSYINNKCYSINKYDYIHPLYGRCSSLIKHKIKVEYSNMYILEMFKHIVLFGNKLDLKFNRPELDIKDKYNSCGLIKEPLQLWTNRIYLQANDDTLINEYINSKEERYTYTNGKWIKHTNGDVVTKNIVIKELLQLNISPIVIKQLLKSKDNL